MHKQDKARFGSWGETLLEQIEKNYPIPRTDYDSEEIGSKSPTFNWTCGIQLAALVEGARRNPRRWSEPLDRFVRGLNRYWNTLGPVPGYDVLPAPKPVDRYYDDNAWVAIALVEAAQVTGKPDYLRFAERTTTYVFSGEDNVLGGGIYWRESDKASKNTCSNGPSAFAALRLYEQTKKPSYLADTRRIYDWTRAHLQDTDGLYWDNINRDGKIERTKWSYNTALMLRTACGLSRATNDPAYRDQAKQMAEASAQKWVRLTTGGIADGSQFAYLLVESFLDYGKLSGEDRWDRTVARALTFLHDRVRDPNGFYGSHWDQPVTAPLQKPYLRDQSSAARALLVAAA